MDAAQRFTLATDDSLPSLPAAARLLAPYAARSDSGLTLWDAWVDRLPRFRENPATLLRDDFRR